MLEMNEKKANGEKKERKKKNKFFMWNSNAMAKRISIA